MYFHGAVRCRGFLSFCGFFYLPAALLFTHQRAPETIFMVRRVHAAAHLCCIRSSSPGFKRSRVPALHRLSVLPGMVPRALQSYFSVFSPRDKLAVILRCFQVLPRDFLRRLRSGFLDFSPSWIIPTGCPSSTLTLSV